MSEKEQLNHISPEGEKPLATDPLDGFDDIDTMFDYPTPTTPPPPATTQPLATGMPPTTGSSLVREDFNPSGDLYVKRIKSLAAELIDLCEELKGRNGRAASIAVTNIEQGARWAVKAATT